MEKPEPTGSITQTWSGTWFGMTGSQSLIPAEELFDNSDVT